MHIFRFTPGTSPTLLQNGVAIPQPISIRWAERYREPGDFEIVARLSSGIDSFLPVGSFISHTDTMEVMVVENQQISEAGFEDPTVTITGRSAEVVLENRVVGADLVRASAYIPKYVLGAYASWQQAVNMINSHIVDTVSAGDKIDYFVATHICTGTPTSEEREINRGGLHTRTLEILAVDDLGIQTIRRNPFTGFGGSPTNTTLQIYQGVDRSGSVIFSWKGGDLETAEYLFSDKALKNSAMVVGNFVGVMVDGTETKYDRRTLYVEATDLDDGLDTIPTGSALTTIQNRMRVRGRQALRGQKRIQITRADVSNLSQFKYRKDYNVGDLVTVDGNFGRIQKLRVDEFVEIEDQNGFSGHPTLSLPGA